MTRTTEQDVEYIREVAKLLAETGLTEISVHRKFSDGDKLSVRLIKFAAGDRPTASPAPPRGDSDTPAPSSPVTDLVENSGNTTKVNAVTSPMVGTVYLAPEPGTGRFVTPGATVVEGQTLLIIEAMKTMNQIPAPRGGTVQEVLVEDGEPVEFGTPLVMIV